MSVGQAVGYVMLVVLGAVAAVGGLAGAALAAALCAPWVFLYTLPDSVRGAAQTYRDWRGFIGSDDDGDDTK